MNTDNQEIFNEELKDTEEFYDFRYNSLRKKGAIISIVMIWLFCLMIFGMAGLHILTDDKDFSESENRVLATFPKLTISTLVDGSFMRDFETYLTDQFPLRDGIISAKTFADRILGKNEENGVYIGKEGHLFDSQTAFDADRVKAISKAVQKFSKTHENFNTAFALIPNSTSIYPQFMPKYLELPQQKEQIKAIRKQINSENIFCPAAYSLLSKNAEKKQLYYKTDHHWTTRGAYIIFKEICMQWGFETSKKDIDKKFDFYEVSTTFEGTLASTSGVHGTTDKIEICVPKNSEGTYVAYFESSGEKTASLFFADKLKNKNQYEVFLGGNYDKVIISTVSPANKSLLLIKDSYANCMIPMLTPYFSKIVVIDPRYLTDSLDSIIKENEFTHMLYLYNLNTLLEDNSLVPCLES